MWYFANNCSIIYYTNKLCEEGVICTKQWSYPRTSFQNVLRKIVLLVICSCKKFYIIFKRLFWISFSSIKYDVAKEDKQLIDSIVESKRVLAPWDLVEETHKKGGAWDKTYKNGSGSHEVIPTELIKAVG